MDRAQAPARLPALAGEGSFSLQDGAGKTKVEINTAQALNAEEELNSQVSFSPTWPERFTLTSKDKGKRVRLMMGRCMH